MKTLSNESFLKNKIFSPLYFLISLFFTLNVYAENDQDYQLFKKTAYCGEIFFRYQKDGSQEGLAESKRKAEGEKRKICSRPAPAGTIVESLTGLDHFPFKKDFFGFLKRKKNRVRSDIPDYKTKNGKIYIELQPGVGHKKKNINEIIDQHFLRYFEGELHSLFDKEYKKIILAGLGDKKLKLKIQKLEEVIFDNKKLSSRETVRKYLYLYSELISRNIESKDPEIQKLRPLLCLYELEHHKERVRKRWSKALSAVSALFGIASFIIPPLAAIPAITLPIAVVLNFGSDFYNIGTYVKGVKNNLAAIKMTNLSLSIHKTLQKELEKIEVGEQLGPDEMIAIDIVVEEGEQEKIDQKEILKELQQDFMKNKDYYMTKNQFLKTNGRNLKIRLISKTGKILATPLLFFPATNLAAKITTNTVQVGQMVARYTGKFRHPRHQLPKDY